jgi:hypothetical protein
MNLKTLINKSYYGTIGYIAKKEDLETLEQYILFNLPVLQYFQNIIIATNYGIGLEEKNTALWKKYFPNCIILDNPVNRGHNHGYTDLDNLVFDYCKENNIQWLCKSANDVIFEESILDKEISDADFYYMNGIGVGGMVKYNFDFNKIVEEDFYPQTNFYFINVSKTDYLNDKAYLDETYNIIQSIPNYNGRIWEYFQGWSCEDFLKQCVIRNNLSKEHLVSEKNYRILLQIVKDSQIHDCSHKQIMIEGICHFPYPEQQIIKI